jgi:hypothetical protein
MLYNYNEITPSQQEVKFLTYSFKNILVKDSSEIIHLQNRVINEISHSKITKGRIDIINNLKYKRGECYDRSMILQKLCIINNIQIRPIYVYFRLDGKKGNWYDIFDKTISSHSFFEFYYKGNWYVMRTNSKMKKMDTISEYFNSQNGILKNAHYIRHLSNRNGKFIFPGWVPDIY